MHDTRGTLSYNSTIVKICIKEVVFLYIHGCKNIKILTRNTINFPLDSSTFVDFFVT